MSSTPRIFKRQGLWGARLFSFETLDSTNTWALEHATTLRHGDIVHAEIQTHGRGRFERTWVAAGGKSLTFSIFLMPDQVSAQHLPLLGPAAALAVRRVLGQRRLSAQLKWPNDVLVRGRKISGILLEKSDSAVVIGIGINLGLSRQDFNKARLASGATSFFVESGVRPRPMPFLQKVVVELKTILQGRAKLVSERTRLEWDKHDFLAAKRIALTTSVGPVHGHYAGMTADWQLQLRDAQGQTAVFSAGDVSLHKQP